VKIAGAGALVTGGSSGLGLATAQALTAAGAVVTVVDLGEPPAGLAFVRGDVRSEDDVRAAIDTVENLRIVVNCAGVATPGRTVGKEGPLPLETFERVLGINLAGTFNVVRLAAARMMQLDSVDEERGVIVNTASVSAFDGQIGQAAYSASKAGVAGMTLPLAREFAQHLIRVMAIAPGIFETPMMAGLPQEAQDSLAAQVPHPSRLGRPAEFAALVQHIVENPMLNGETIRLDGAIRMGPR
jgi:NAD(P)-dependent dehydrogenase (short-subunit alcohol dehydrogenase family)